MRIILDGKEVDFKLPDKEVKVRDVVDEVEQFLFSVGQVPTALSINGTELSQEDLDSRQEECVSGEETFDFGTVNIFEWVITHLEGAKGANQALRDQIQKFGEEIHQTEKSVEAESLIQEIDHFFQFWVRMYGLIKEQFDDGKFEGKGFAEFIETMKQMLEEVLGAMEEEDWVLASDLLQYEMAPQIDALDQALPGLLENIKSLAEKERALAGSKMEAE